MKIFALALVLVVPALAFTPVSKIPKASTMPLEVAKATSALPYENELGVMAPTGFFDPLGLSKDIDQETFDFYRAAELKNGRACMLFVIGYIVPEFYRFPGEIAPGIKFADVPNGIAALNVIPALGWMQIFFLIGAVDYYGFLGNFEAGKQPDLSAEEMEKRSMSELAHCRLAMLAFLELLRHDAQNYISPGFDGYDKLITGLPFLYN
jgi:Chlorophyll A-B binding protein